MYLLGYTRAHLALNRRLSDGAILPWLGLGNILTLVRGLLYGLLAGFVVLPTPSGAWAFVPGALYTVASLTDLLDGRLARRRGETTALGAKLDVEVDSVGVLVASVLAVKSGQLPAIFLAVGGLFYAYRLALWVHRRRGRSIYPLPEDAWRSRIGGFQVGLLCVVLWPVFSPPLTTWAGAVLATPVVFSFARDGLVATGHLDPHSAAYRRAVGALRRGLLVRLPVLLRTVVAVAAAYYLLATGTSAPAMHLHTGLVVLVAAGGIAVAAGLGGRIAALIMLSVSAFVALRMELGAALAAVVLGALVLLLTGTGPYSLQPGLPDFLVREKMGK